MKQSCIECGYRMLHLHKECPMCEKCEKCGKTLNECTCHESE